MSNKTPSKASTRFSRAVKEVRFVLDTSKLTWKGMAIGVIGIFVSGGVAAAGLYGLATDDYSVLKELAEAVRVAVVAVTAK